MFTRFCSAALATALAAACLFSGGCGSSNGMPPSGVVTGEVTHNGRPVPGGTVVFHLAGNPKKNGAAIIKSDGSYKVFDAPPGECKIVVMPPEPGGQSSAGGQPGYARSSAPPQAKIAGMPDDLKGEKPEEAAKIQLPPKYAKPETTDITFEVEEGDNEFDIELKD